MSVVAKFVKKLLSNAFCYGSFVQQGQHRRRKLYQRVGQVGVAPMVHYGGIENVFRDLISGNGLPFVYKPEHGFKEVFKHGLAGCKFYAKDNGLGRIVKKAVVCQPGHQQAFAGIEVHFGFAVL